MRVNCKMCIDEYFRPPRIESYDRIPCAGRLSGKVTRVEATVSELRES